MDGTEQQDVSDAKKAAENADETNKSHDDAYESLTNKLVQAKDYVSDQAEEAKEFVEKKLEEIHGH